jgi:hypothetical protein
VDQVDQPQRGNFLTAAKDEIVRPMFSILNPGSIKVNSPNIHTPRSTWSTSVIY